MQNNPLSLVVLLHVLVVVPLFVSCGSADNGPSALCLSGKCDGSNVRLYICGPREVATRAGGCVRQAETELGLVPGGQEKAIRIPWVARADWGTHDQVALVFFNSKGQQVHRYALPFRKYWTGEYWWRGHDVAGQDVEGLISVIVEARVDGVVHTSPSHEIARLVRLPDPGVDAGYVHPLGSDKKGSDDWGRPHVIQALVDVARSWPHKDRPIAYMDISQQNGGEFEPHHYHRRGESIDIRYVRRDPGVARLHLDKDEDLYDREATQQLVDLLIAFGAEEIWADERAGLQGNRIVRVVEHANHFHVFFPLEPFKQLRVNERFVGGACLDTSDCDYRYSRCLREPEQLVGICTRDCTTSCEERDGGRYTATVCVQTNHGNLCMPSQDLTRFPQGGCDSGLWPISAPSGAGKSVAVCLPGSSGTR